MYELLWTAVGAAVALCLLQVWRLWTRPEREDQGDDTTTQPLPPQASATFASTPLVTTVNVSAEPRALASSLAEDLASLVSAVEAHAHHLIEAAPMRTQVPRAAEALLASIARVHTLQKKLVAFGEGRSRQPGTTDVTELIDSLGDELGQMQLGLEIRWDPPSSMPPLDVHPTVARDVMLFACAALLRAERGATRLTFSVEPSFSRARPTIKIELNLEHISCPGTPDADDVQEPDTGGEFAAQAFALDLEAARRLVTTHGGEVTLSHLPGRSVRAVVRLPMAGVDDEGDAAAVDVDASGVGTDDREHAHVRTEPQAEPDEAPDAHDAAPTDPSVAVADAPTDEVEPVGHDYGGALVLEADPALRSVLARELKASGRAVFACSDGAAAHTFLEATPDRFELLIVDDALQLAEHTPLARTIRSRAPGLKICLLTPRSSQPPPKWPGVHCLQKPFGVHELRRTLAAILPTA